MKKTATMLKAVLDSSVLISAFITPTGTCGKLLDGVEAGRFRLALSLEILAETEDKLLHKPKLMQKYDYAPEHVENFCDGLLGIAELVTDLPEGRFVPDDPKDDIVVATAIKAGVDVLVAGDHTHLVNKKELQGIPISSVRAFLNRLQEAE